MKETGPSSPIDRPGRTVPGRIVCLLLALAFGWTGCHTAPIHQRTLERARYDFALIGDLPYSAEAEDRLFPSLQEDINRHRLAFIVHDGDIKSGASPCHDAILEERLERFQNFRHPFVLIFGDNEWTDCRKENKERGPDDLYDPVERLNRCRELFCAGNRSLGQRTMPLNRQSDTAAFPEFRENVRWTYGNVLFVGLNIVGTGNNHGQPEYARRNEANLEWLKASFDLAQQQELRGIMIIIQANPFFERSPNHKTRLGYNDFLKVLEKRTLAFGRPVVLVHGDTHNFRIDKPLKGSKSGRRVENFTRVETFGHPDAHWLRVRVDWRDPAVFSFHQQIVEDNILH